MRRKTARWRSKVVFLRLVNGGTTCQGCDIGSCGVRWTVVVASCQHIEKFHFIILSVS